MNMNKISAITTKEKYKTELSNGTKTLIADENTQNGGKDAGFDPQELLSASLASCTSITLRMYADHKNMDIDKIEVTVEIKKDDTLKQTHFERSIKITGSISEDQSDRLLSVADKCPVHKILMGTSYINTLMV